MYIYICIHTYKRKHMALLSTHAPSFFFLPWQQLESNVSRIYVYIHSARTHTQTHTHTHTSRPYRRLFTRIPSSSYITCLT